MSVGGGVLNQNNLGGMGRRLDQVQSRRRRMKTAKNMKVLYHYTEGIIK